MTLSNEQYFELGKKQLEDKTALYESIISLFPKKRKEQVNSLMNSEVGNQFFVAPASSRRSFHYAFPCGLFLHSLNVVKNALTLNKSLCNNRWEPAKVAFAALFHDIGKAGTAGNPYYQPIDQSDWRWKKGEFYELSKDEWMPTSEKGLYILQQHGVEIDHDEYMAIRLNDGAGPAENKPYSFREPALALVIHWADHWATVCEKEEDQQ